MTDPLHQYLLHLADNALILGHRNSEWCGHGPILEQDIALTNISLDLIGQARYFYQYAARRKGAGLTEDSLAYLRSGNEFLNLLLLELPDENWGFTILRQYLFSQFQHLVYAQLQNSRDADIAGVADKAIKETAYHLRWSRDWVVRLGDGTEDSHGRMIAAWEKIKDYLGEFFIPAHYETVLSRSVIAADPASIKNTWTDEVISVFNEATIPFSLPVWSQSGGKNGIHTEHLGYILTEMQYMQRAYPGLEW